VGRREVFGEDRLVDQLFALLLTMGELVKARLAEVLLQLRLGALNVGGLDDGLLLIISSARRWCRVGPDEAVKYLSL